MSFNKSVLGLQTRDGLVQKPRDKALAERFRESQRNNIVEVSVGSEKH